MDTEQKSVPIEVSNDTKKINQGKSFLIQFSVENFLSFKEEVTFSMLASEDISHDENNTFTFEGEKYLKSVVIFGANASGKSNLLKAMNKMALWVKFSGIKDDFLELVNFKLCEKSYTEPVKMDIVFVCDDVKYAYGFAVKNNIVIKEYLSVLESEEENEIFTRENGKFDFSKNPEKEAGAYEFLVDFSAENKLFLTTAGSYKKLSNIVAWFDNFLWSSNLSAYNYLKSNFFNANYSGNKSNDIIEKVIEWTKKIDTGIEDIKINGSSSVFDDDYFNNGNYNAENFNKILNKIETTKIVKGSEDTVFNFNAEESEGTISFFNRAIVIAEKLLQGNVLIWDELDAAFHVLVAKFVVSLYHNNDENPSFSQLIFTTHNTNLLDLEVFRRDQIWFVDKKSDTGSSEIFSLDEFGERTDVNVEKSYLYGVYGAIPFIKEVW